MPKPLNESPDQMMLPLEPGFEPEDNASETINRPFDPAEVRIESKPLTLGQLITRVRHAEIDLAPDFQRAAGIWKARQKSRLIESILVRIPIPAFYFDARNEDRWLVIDGLQRLSTLKEFVIDQSLKLEDLEFLQQFDGFAHGDLDRTFQRRIDETQVTISCIQPGTPDAVTYNLFKRINTGGEPLTSQEIRNALNPGPVTKFLQKLAEDTCFQQATHGGFDDRRMTDRECALRFCAFRLSQPNSYDHADFDGFLNDRMAELNRMSEAQRQEEFVAFHTAMGRALELFGNQAFRRSNGDRRTPLNKAIFESWSVNLAALNEVEWGKLLINQHRLLVEWQKLCSNDTFSKSVSQATGNGERVRRRFRMVEEIINCAIHDH